jgi:hypothetical protein
MAQGIACVPFLTMFLGLDPPPLYSTAPRNLTVAGSSADTSLEHRARRDLARYLTTEFAGQAKWHAIRINGHRKILRLLTSIRMSTRSLGSNP